jgi:putative oxidoreductase
MPSDSVRTLDRPANLDAGLLLARIMLSALFLVSGYFKLMAVERTTGYFASLGIPMPNVMVWVAILVEIGLPILLLLGIRARWVALALCVFTLITAATGHRFWGFDTAAQFPQYVAQLTQFLKNLGIAGGFLLLALIGPGRYAVDRRG